MKSKYYDSIDNCPILLFIQISEGIKNTLYLCYEGDPNEADAEIAWLKLYDEFIDAFNVSVQYKQFIREKIKLCEMLKGFHVDGHSWQKGLIEIKKQEIRRLEELMTTGSDDFHVIVGRLSKSMGFGIDPNKTTVRQFYSYMKAL